MAYSVWVTADPVGLPRRFGSAYRPALQLGRFGLARVSDRRSGDISSWGRGLMEELVSHAAAQTMQLFKVMLGTHAL